MLMLMLMLMLTKDYSLNRFLSDSTATQMNEANEIRVLEFTDFCQTVFETENQQQEDG